MSLTTTAVDRGVLASWSCATFFTRTCSKVRLGSCWSTVAVQRPFVPPCWHVHTTDQLHDASPTRRVLWQQRYATTVTCGGCNKGPLASGGNQNRRKFMDLLAPCTCARSKMNCWRLPLPLPVLVTSVSVDFMQPPQAAARLTSTACRVSYACEHIECLTGLCFSTSMLLLH